jgi:hypothetical protein
LLLIGPVRRLLSRRWGRAVPISGAIYEGSVERQPEPQAVIEGEYRREP